MNDLNDINQTNLEEIEEQIKVRKELIDQMVGTLYPSILWGEIEKLEEWKQNAVVTRGSIGFEQ